MRKVPCNFLQPGMEVGSNVYDSDGKILLSKGSRLTKAFIRNLILKGISSIYVNDFISNGIFPNVIVDEETTVQTKIIAKKMINNTYHRLLNSDVSNLRAQINNIINQVLENTNLIYDLMHIRSIDDYLFGHSVNVGVLSLITGIALNYSEEKLSQLAMGAILHDIGKALVPPDILNKPGNLSELEFDEIKKHPSYSLDLLKTNSYIDSVSRLIAYQHHEKYNGEGYPLGVSGDAILEMSQIVGMVDMYDAITSDRCYREAMPPNEAYELLAGAGNVYFKYAIIKAFLSKIAAYPAGTMVELNTGQIAIVVANYSNYPITPKMRIILEADGSIAKPFLEINLALQLKVSIKKVLAENKVKQIITYYKKGKEKMYGL